MEDASKLLEMDGPQVLATAMAILDSRHADLQRAVCDRPSILSGKKGYLCILANDPDHTVATTEGEVQRIVTWTSKLLMRKWCGRGLGTG